jgi:hypothetical protein
MNKSVDIVIAAYNEDPEHINATIRACLSQDHAVQSIYVIDDGSPSQIELAQDFTNPNIYLHRLPQNQGLPAARNAGISLGDSNYVACINVEVLPSSDWLSTCLDYMQSHPEVGACCSRIENLDTESLLTRWRTRFIEKRYEHDTDSGEVDACTGHAVLFRRDILELVDGYDDRFNICYEDADICFRIKKAGFSSHVVSGTHVEYIQDDTLHLLAKKTLRNSGWALKPKYVTNPTLRPVSFPRLAANQTYRLFHRMGRNLFKLRLSFLPIDLAVWGYALRIGWEASKEFSASRS